MRIETRALGRAHALEHRRARREARRLAAQLGPPEPPPRRQMAVGPPSVVGQWSGKTHIDVTGIHAILLPTGKVLFFNYGPSAEGIAAIWDPETGARRRVDPPGGDNLWCGGQTLLADGRVLVAGGNAPKTSDLFNGLDTIYTFDPWTETWMFQGRMNEGRWYPTTTTLPDGRVLITSGRVRDGSGNINEDVDVFTPNPDPTKRGTVQTVARRWLNMYPQQHVIRDGRVLVSGPSGVDVGIFNPANWGFTPLPHQPNGNHTKGSAVLLPDGPGGSSKVMVIGGVGEDEVEIIDARQPRRRVGRRAPLPQTRRNTNSVLTPDGAVITIGGNLEENYISPQKEALRYDPAADTWTPLAAQAEERGLPLDGAAPPGRPHHVGGRRRAVRPRRPERRDRGLLAALPLQGRPAPDHLGPDAVAYGSAFTVATPDTDVAKAVLVAPGATTHANDMHQRLVPLAMTPTAGGLQLTAPATTSIAPPGHYMLFLVDSAGVPSVARFLAWPPTASPPRRRTRPRCRPRAAGRRDDALPARPPGPGRRRPALTPGPGPSWLRSRRGPTGARASRTRSAASRTRRGCARPTRAAGALRVGSGAVVPGPALLAGTYRAILRVRSGGVRLTATATGRTITLALAADARERSAGGA